MRTMSIDWSLSIGSILQIATMIATVIIGWMKLSSRLDVFDETIKNHSTLLTKLTERLDVHDKRIVDVVSDLSRLIGRSEVEREHK